MTTKIRMIGMGVLAAIGLAAPLPATAVQAQRTFVSSGGFDTDPCSLAFPCRQLPGSPVANEARRRDRRARFGRLRAGDNHPGSVDRGATRDLRRRVGNDPRNRRDRRQCGRHRRSDPARIDDQQSGRQQRHRVQQRRCPLRRKLHDSRLRARRNGECQVRAGRRLQAVRQGQLHSRRPDRDQSRERRHARRQRPSTTRGSRATSRALRRASPARSRCATRSSPRTRITASACKPAVVRCWMPRSTT